MGSQTILGYRQTNLIGTRATTDGRLRVGSEPATLTKLYTGNQSEWISGIADKEIALYIAYLRNATDGVETSPQDPNKKVGLQVKIDWTMDPSNDISAPSYGAGTEAEGGVFSTPILGGGNLDDDMSFWMKGLNGVWVNKVVIESPRGRFFRVSAQEYDWNTTAHTFTAGLCRVYAMFRGEQ